MNPRRAELLKRLALLLTEALLVLIIIGLLLAIWAPALVGARPGSGRW